MTVHSSNLTNEQKKELVEAWKNASELHIKAVEAGLTVTPFINAATAAQAVLTSKYSGYSQTEDLAVYEKRIELANAQKAYNDLLLAEKVKSSGDAINTTDLDTTRTAVYTAITNLTNALNTNQAVSPEKANAQVSAVRNLIKTDGLNERVADLRALNEYEKQITTNISVLKDHTETPENIQKAEQAILNQFTTLGDVDKSKLKDSMLAMLGLFKEKREFDAETARIKEANNLLREGQPENVIDPKFENAVKKAETELVKVVLGHENYYHYLNNVFEALDPTDTTNDHSLSNLTNILFHKKEAEKGFNQELSFLEKENPTAADSLKEAKTRIENALKTKQTAYAKQVQEEFDEAVREYNGSIESTQRLVEAFKRVESANTYKKETVLASTEMTLLKDVDVNKTDAGKKIGPDTVKGKAKLDKLKEELEKSNPSASNNNEVEALQDQIEEIGRGLEEVKNRSVGNQVVKTVNEVTKPFNYEEHVPKEVRDKLEQVSTHKPNTLLTVGIAAGAAVISGIVAYIAAISGNTTKKDDKTNSVKG